ncbi:uncharacterized protein LOC134770219 [Penaeus indicus]|uniref:uncharacterized protein LOC134770219 n=1 Tax=Penaeus indicus TaxID=29960 RepID=UPI00300C6789
MFGCAPKYELRLPERLELPSLDEVRASSQGNPIGQVPTQPHPLVSPPLTFRPSLMSNLPSCQSSLTLGAPPAPTPIPQTVPLPSHIPQKSPLGHLMSSTLTSPLHVPPIPTLQPHVPPPSPYSLLSPISSPTPPVNPSSPQWLKYFTLPSSALYASPTLQYLNLHHSALQPQQPSPISPSGPISYTETNSSLFPQWGAPYATPPLKSQCKRRLTQTPFPQYNLDFRGLSPRGRGNSPYRSDGDDLSGSGNNSATGGGSGSEGNISGGTRRALGGRGQRTPLANSMALFSCFGTSIATACCVVSEARLCFHIGFCFGQQQELYHFRNLVKISGKQPRAES